MDYTTIREPANAVLVEKRSRFIADLAPVQSEGQAKDFVESVRTRHPDARHHIFAYLLENGARRSSDDGEPQGTAGAPALEVLDRRGLCNVAVVVTRYFGGVLLGAPGLVRAYSKAVRLAADAASLLIMRRCERLSVCVDYARSAAALRLAQQTCLCVESTRYGADVSFTVLIAAGGADAFVQALEGITCGTARCESEGETFWGGEDEKI